MPLDSAQAGLGFEIASLRALGEGRRRRSHADRLLRERRAAGNTPDVPAPKMIIEPASPQQSPTERRKPDGAYRLD